MTDLPSSTNDLRGAVIRFDTALSNLESRLNIALEALNNVKHAPSIDPDSLSNDDNNLILHEELAGAKSREKELEGAVISAREALNDAINDIRQMVGNV